MKLGDIFDSISEICSARLALSFHNCTDVFGVKRLSDVHRKHWLTGSSVITVYL